jgi:hypothetical protein
LVHCDDERSVQEILEKQISRDGGGTEIPCQTTLKIDMDAEKGYSNTRFFHLHANMRKKEIVHLHINWRGWNYHYTRK